MLNDWSHKVRAILKEYCPGNIEKLLPSLSQSGNTRFYFGHQKLCMDNNGLYCSILGHTEKAPSFLSPFHKLPFYLGEKAPIITFGCKCTA